VSQMSAITAGRPAMNRLSGRCVNCLAGLGIARAL